MVLDYYDPDDLDVRVSELLVATSDGADTGVNPNVQEVLRLLREKLGMDVVFVSEFLHGERVFRFVDSAPAAPKIPPGSSDPLEASWCQRVVDGRLPEYIRDAKPLIDAGATPPTAIPIGTHISTPIVAKGGRVYGTLCCFSAQVNGDSTEHDLQRLKYTALLLASKLGKADAWPTLPKR
jgi:GAF domain-containing protein